MNLRSRSCTSSGVRRNHLAEFLFRITGAQSGKGIGILASHPMTEDRREIMQRADRPNTGPELLSTQEWRELKTICRR